MVAKSERKKVKKNNTCSSDNISDKPVQEAIWEFDYAGIKYVEDQDLTPKKIVGYLNKYVVGQSDAKKKVAIAFRYRQRRICVSGSLGKDITPKNILMIGPTGVGKTEIARRLSKISGGPFIKVEATKFTEIGYVGKDVDSIIRDLVEVAISNVKDAKRTESEEQAKSVAVERIIDVLVGDATHDDGVREIFREKFHSGDLDDKEIEIKVKDSPNLSNVMPSFELPGGHVASIGNVGDMLNKVFGNVNSEKTKLKKMQVNHAFKTLVDEEVEASLDQDEIIRTALYMTTNFGIVFLDEVDKIVARKLDARSDISKEGVQRDLLPLLEGTTVNTKYGPVQTDHILFVASGAFHYSNPSDLLPEFQGRLPIRVELQSLKSEDFVKILKDTESSLLKQYVALFATERISVRFTESAILKIAKFTEKVNAEVLDLGARRLHTIVEKIFDDINFPSDTEVLKSEYLIDELCVENALKNVIEKTDLSKFIL